MIIDNTFSTVEELEEELHRSHYLYSQYVNLGSFWKPIFEEYMLGKRTLPLTYDPFFKRIFNPEIHPDRLSDFLSSILGQKVTVTHILPNQNIMLKGSSLFIMDIVVRLEDGSLTNVEIQKMAVAFLCERMSCYSADLLLRQYEQIRARSGKKFNYSKMNKVYTIIIYENTDGSGTLSPVYRAFHEPDMKNIYVHHGKTTFDSGLSLELLQEFYLIPLDVFRINGYAKNDDKLTAWLSLLSTKYVSEAELLIKKYPWFEKIFIEMAEYMHKPEEVLSMFSEALRIMDENTALYMIDEMKDEIAEKRKYIEEQDERISEQSERISEQNEKIDSLQSENKAQRDLIVDLQAQLEMYKMKDM